MLKKVSQIGARGKLALRRRPVLAAAIFLVFSLTLVFHRVVFLGETFQAAQRVPGVLPAGPYLYPGNYPAFYVHGSDPGGSGWQPAAETEKISQEWKAGRVPLWNPNQMFGTPLLSNLQISATSPLRQPFFILGASVGGWDVYYLLLFFLSGIFTFLFLRLFQLSWAGAIAGGLCFMLSGFTVMYIHFAFMDAVVMIPALFFAIERWARSPRAWDIGWLAIFFGATFLCGYPVPVVLTVFFSGIYGLVRTAMFPSWTTRFLRASALGLAVFLGLLLAAVVLLPGGQLLSHAQNTRPPGIGVAHEFLIAAYGLLIPQILTTMRPETVPSFWAGWLGIVPVILAGLGIVSRNPRYRFLLLFFGLAALLAFMKQIGFWPAQALAYLPPFNRMMFPRYIQPLLAFAMAILTALGVEQVLREKFRPHTLGFIAGTLSIAVLFCLGRQLDLYGDWSLSYGNGKRVLWFFVWQILFLAAIFFKRGRCPGVIVGLLLLEMGSYAQATRCNRYSPFVEAPYVTFLKEEVKKTDRARVLAIDGFLFPPFASAYDFDDVRWMNALSLPYYRRFINSFVLAKAEDRFIGDEKALRLLEPTGGLNRHLSLANTRYLITANNSLAIPRKTPLRLIYDKEARIYENPEALPRAFLVHRVVVVKSEDDVVATLQDPAIRFAETAVVTAPIPELRAAKNKSQAKLLTYNSQTVEVETQSDAPGLLVVTDTYYPNWKASVDGTPQPVLRVDLAFRGVVVPAGTHRVVFRYEDGLFQLGFWISLSTLLLLAGKSWLTCPTIKPPEKSASRR